MPPPAPRRSSRMLPRVIGGPCGCLGFIVVTSRQADVFKEPDLDQLISVTLVAKLEPISSCHRVSHGLLLGPPLVSGKCEPPTNDSPLCIGPKHNLLFY